MSNLSSNYFIKILNIYDNQNTICINHDKHFAISVYIQKHTFYYKDDSIRYKVRIWDDLNKKYYKFIPNIDNEFPQTVCRDYNHFSLSPDEKLKFSLKLVDEILEKRQLKLKEFLTVQN